MTVETKYAGSADAQVCRGQAWVNDSEAVGVEDNICASCPSPNWSCDIILDNFNFSIPDGW